VLAASMVAAVAYGTAPQLPRTGTVGACVVIGLWGFAIACLARRLGSFVLLGPLVASAAGIGVLAAGVGASAAGVNGVSDVLKALGALGAGLGLAQTLQRPWWTMPTVLCVTVADVWSVFAQSGVTRTVVEEAPSLLPLATLQLPLPGASYGQGLALGVVDVLFIGLFMGVAWGWGFARWRAELGIGAGLALVTAASIWHDGRPVPALPGIGVAWLLACAPELIRDARRR